MSTPTKQEPEETMQAVTAPATGRLAPAFPDEDDDSPDALFLRAVAEIPTQPLVQTGKTAQERAAERRVLLGILLFFLSFVGSTAVCVLTYPTVTITITPVSKSASLTAPLDVAISRLAPVTITKTQTIRTTGTGHQSARIAIGTLTFYNGLFTPQYIPGGTRFTRHGGIQVITTEAATIPASDPSTNPPQFGSTTVTASATQAGAAGNIAAYSINATVVDGVSVKNTGQFQHGRDARDYRAVARHDLDGAIVTLKHSLSQEIAQAFPLLPGEAVSPTACHLSTIADHAVGQEAQTVTIQAAYTCQGIAYNQDQLQQQATTVFTHRMSPGAHYTLVGSVTSTLVGGSPVTVLIHGLWVYQLPEDYEQFLAQQIAGENPQQARAYLLHTGFITRASIPQTLPKDPQHIKFLELVGI